MRHWFVSHRFIFISALSEVTYQKQLAQRRIHYRFESAKLKECNSCILTLRYKKMMFEFYLTLLQPRKTVTPPLKCQVYEKILLSN